MLKKFVAIAGLAIFCAGLIEVIFCYLILPQNFLYYESSYRKFPHFWLKSSYRAGVVQIENGRRQVRSAAVLEGLGDAKVGGAKGVAFVGDSVTFGWGVAQSNTLPQQIADRLPDRLVHNYGVPGYGLLEYRRVVEDRIAPGQFAHIVVTLVSNDVYPASVGRLPLLIRGGETITYWPLHEKGLIGYAKYLLFRYFKTGYFVLLQLRPQPERREPVPDAGQNEPPAQCGARLRRENLDYREIFDRQQAMYTDRQVRAGLDAGVADLAAAIRRKGAEPVFVLNYYLGHLIEGPGAYRDSMRAAVAKAGAPLLDLHEPLLAALAGNECRYFADPGHPGPAHNAAIAEAVAGLIQAPARPGAPARPASSAGRRD